jgi:hypothetical protein
VPFQPESTSESAKNYSVPRTNDSELFQRRSVLVGLDARSRYGVSVPLYRNPYSFNLYSLEAVLPNLPVIRPRFRL